MQRPLLINTSLLALALLLAGLVWLSLEQQNKDQNTTITSLLPDQITQIVIENSKDPSIRLERKANGWMMTSPSMAKADDVMVSNLLEITRTKSIRRFSAPDNLEEFGLDPPMAVLTLDQTRIEMGAIHPMNQRRYLRVGNMIHMINDRFPHLLQAGPEGYMAAKAP